MTLLSGQRPSLRNWLAYWIVGFVSICLLGTALSGALWLVGQGAKALGPPYAAITEFSLSTALRIVPLVAGGFGIFLATAMISQWRRDERVSRECRIRIPGHHPLIGDFAHAPFYKNWSAHPSLPGGQNVHLWGHGPEPSAAETFLWFRFLARADELLLRATDDLLRQEHGYHACESVTLIPGSIQLRGDGKIEILFDISTVPEDFFPSAYFETLPEGYREEYPCAIFTPSLELERTFW